MIQSPQNEQLKTIRKLRQRRWRERLDLFAAEGEDLVDAAARAGRRPELLLRAGREIEPELLRSVSALGSGARAIGVYRRAWSEPGGRLMVYLHAVDDPGNVGAIVRSACALGDGPVLLGAGCADPFSPKAVRASMGAIFARPPARAPFHELPGIRVAMDPGAERPLAEVAKRLARAARRAPGAQRDPIVLCLGSEREGLPPELASDAEHAARIPLRTDGPESLNVAMAATLALYEVANRMAGHA